MNLFVNILKKQLDVDKNNVGIVIDVTLWAEKIHG